MACSVRTSLTQGDPAAAILESFVADNVAFENISADVLLDPTG